MSAIDDVLITIDDKPGITQEEILAINDKSQKPAVYSALARLESKGLIKKSSHGFEITSSGKQRIDTFLDGLDELKQNEKHWHLVIIEISEREKLTREKLRYQFQKIGVGTLKKGVYIYYGHDLSIIKTIFDELKLTDQAYLLPINHLDSQIARKIATKAWNWDQLNEQYQNFIDFYDNFEQNLKLHSQDLRRIEAKKAVFNLAKLFLKDPKIPQELAPTGFLRLEAYRLYEKIRPYCYE